LAYCEVAVMAKKKKKKKKEKVLKLFHFSCGNSSEGSIGFCAAIAAKDKKSALERLQELLPEEDEICWPYGERKEEGEYIQVYFNEANRTCDDIDDLETLEDAEEVHE